MPTSTSLGLVIPANGNEPADLYGVSTRLGQSVDDYLSRQRLAVANFAALPSAGDYNGHSIWVTDQNRHAVWNGTIWVMRTLSVSGILTIVPVANTPTSGTITFPTGLFYAAPKVHVTPNTSAPGTAVTGVGATAISTTGATLWVTRTSTTSTDLLWTAILGA